VKKYKLLSLRQPFIWSKISTIRRRKKEENKHIMRERKKEIVIYDKNEC
jgi:hypothetical protein